MLGDVHTLSKCTGPEKDHIWTMGVITHFLAYIPKDVWKFVTGGSEQTMSGEKTAKSPHEDVLQTGVVAPIWITHLGPELSADEVV